MYTDVENNELNFYDVYDVVGIILPKKWDCVNISIICPTNTVKYKFTVVTTDGKKLDSSELPQYAEVTQKDVKETILELVFNVLKYVYGDWAECYISMTWDGGFNMKLLYS